MICDEAKACKGIIECCYRYAGLVMQNPDGMYKVGTFDQVKRGFALGLALPLSYNHLLLRPTVAFPTDKPVVEAGIAPVTSRGDDP